MTSPSCVLVLAEPTLRERTRDGRCTTATKCSPAKRRSEAIQLLELHSGNIGYAVLSPEGCKRSTSGTLLADEYPTIQRLVLS